VNCRRTFRGMEQDSWTRRDLPVLKAIVRIYDETGRERISPAEVQRAVNFDEDTAQRAIRALYRQPYLEPGYEAYGGGYIAVGPPTGDALRLAGQWPAA
jgi:hypothetical protein